MEVSYLELSRTYFYASRMILYFLLIVFAYVIFVNLSDISIPCQYSLLHQGSCPSCGLTRGVFETLRFDFSAARVLNGNSVIITCFLLLQLFYRVAVVFGYTVVQKVMLPALVLDGFISLTPLFINGHG